jgi:TonB family protein
MPQGYRSAMSFGAMSCMMSFGMMSFGMMSLLLLVASRPAAALEPKPTDNEKTAIAPEQKDRSKVKSTASRWQIEVVRLIISRRRYPAGSALLGQWGRVDVKFSVDRQGRVTRSRVVRSSGYAALDNAALELVGQPYPPPPPGQRLDLAISINYDPALACGPGDRYVFAREYCTSRTQSQKPQ